MSRAPNNSWAPTNTTARLAYELGIAFARRRKAGATAAELLPDVAFAIYPATTDEATLFGIMLEHLRWEFEVRADGAYVARGEVKEVPVPTEERDWSLEIEEGTFMDEF